MKQKLSPDITFAHNIQSFKVLERIIANQLTDYLEKNKLLSDTQHGFRTSVSTETALLTFSNTLSYEREREKPQPLPQATETLFKRQKTIKYIFNRGSKLSRECRSVSLIFYRENTAQGT